MKIKLTSITLAAILAIAGATSVFANDYDSNEWRKQLITSGSQADQKNRLNNDDKLDTGTKGTVPCPSPCH